MQTYRISQAATLLGISKWTLRNWTRRGLVPHMQMPTGRWKWSWRQIQEIRANMALAEGDEDDADAPEKGRQHLAGQAR